MAEISEQRQVGGFSFDAPAGEPDLHELRQMASVAPAATGTTCPHCLRSSADPVLLVTDEDKRGWLRMLLGAGRFVKRYQLFDGQGEVTFQARRVGEREELVAALRAELESGRLAGGSSPAAAALMEQRSLELRMAGAVVSINNVPCAASGAVADRFKALFSDMSEDMYVIVRQAFVSFEALCIQLRLGATSPDFWKGIKSPS